MVINCARNGKGQLGKWQSSQTPVPYVDDNVGGVRRRGGGRDNVCNIVFHFINVVSHH